MHPELLDILLPSSAVVLFTFIEALLPSAAYYLVARAQGLDPKRAARGAALWSLVCLALLTNTWRGWPAPARLEILTYWVLDLLAFGLVIALCRRAARRSALAPEPFVAAAPVFIPFALILSRLFFLARDHYYGQLSPLDSLPAGSGLLSTNQGVNTFMVVLGGGFGLLLFLSIKRLPRLAYLDVLYTHTPLGLALGKLGCFSAGCCWGLQSGSSLAIRFPPGSPPFSDQNFAGLISSDAPASLPLVPVQLYESACMFLLFALLVLFAKRLSKPGQRSSAFLFGYALIQWFVESLRGDAVRGGPLLGANNAFYNLTLHQALAVGAMIASLWMALALRRSWSQSEVVA